jgi:hypothetical protein
MQDVVNAELTVRHQGFQAMVKPLDNLTEEDTALGEWIQELGVRALEKILWEKI